jgi:hypothetical protein
MRRSRTWIARFKRQVRPGTAEFKRMWNGLKKVDELSPGVIQAIKFLWP